LNGRRCVLQIRSMCENARRAKRPSSIWSKPCNWALKIPNDPRLTGVGPVAAQNSKSTNGRIVEPCSKGECRWWARVRRSAGSGADTRAGSGPLADCAPGSPAVGRFADAMPWTETWMRSDIAVHRQTGRWRWLGIYCCAPSRRIAERTRATRFASEIGGGAFRLPQSPHEAKSGMTVCGAWRY